MTEPQAAPVVLIQLDRQEAERLSWGLSDLLCWHGGFAAARAGTDLDDDRPMGIEAVRTLNLKIKDAL